MRKAFKPLALLAASAAVITTPAIAQDAPAAAKAQPMSARDLVTMPRLGSPNVSADGKRTLFSVTTTDKETLARTTAYRVKTLATGAEVDLALPKGGNSPVFAEGNTIYFLAPGGEGAEGMQIFTGTLLDDGGLARIRQVSALNRSVEGFKLAPGAKRVAIYGETLRTCLDYACDDTVDATSSETPVGSGRLYEGDAGFVRHWDTWKTPGSYNRVFVYDIGENGLTSPQSIDNGLGEGSLVGDTPTKPFGGPEDFAFAPDGNSIWFVARETGAAEPASTDLDIYRYDLTVGILSELTADNEATDTAPTPSPDGKSLAYLAMARPGYESDRLVVMLHDIASGTTRALTQDFDRSFGSLAWTPDSRWIIATAQSVLDTPAYRIDPRTGKVTELDLLPGNEAHIGNVTPAGKNTLLFTRDSIAGPAELYLSSGWKQATRLSDVATTRMAGLAPIEKRRFNFAGAGGDKVWGQITKPSGVEGPLPAILYVHGGPQGSFNDGWSSRWNPRVLASQGYAVISVDFHGSTGYGQAFTDAINQDWGGKPLEDLQKGLAAALALDTQIDGTRACAMGASYGGYMMNWIAGNWADRFDCLVQHDGLFDMRSFYYATEELWFPRWDFGGSYTEQSALYEKWNPVNHVDKWQTPMLVITGEKDFRVPYTQGIQSFTALQERGIPSQLLVFPDENHWVLKPKNSLQWHETVFAWLDRWLGEDAE